MRYFIVLMCSVLLFARTQSQSLSVKKVIATEYHVFYIASDNNVYSFLAGYSKAVQFPIGGRKAIDGAGAFNVFRVLDDQGYIWSSRQDLATDCFRFDTDSSGNAFNGNTSVYAYENTCTTIKSDGSVWYFGDDTFHLFHSSGGVNMRAMQLSPAGMAFKKIVMGGNRIVGLTTAGDVYEWVSKGSRTPAKKTIPLPAIDIFASHMDYAGCLIPTSAGATSGYPYVWGYNYGCWGGTTTYSQPTSVQALWKVTLPIKVIDANWNTTHFIDTLGRLFGMGYNVQGEVGNGQEFVNKYNYPTFPGYGWDFSDGEDPVSTPVQIAPNIKFSQLFSNNWFAFFKYALDVNGNLYSWGRNKAMDLGNGYLDMQEADHPNSLDVLVPTLVTPLTSYYQTYNWTGPSISAGATQNITGSTATLTGTATAPQLIAATTVAANGITKVGYSIVSYKWTKVSGGNATITSPAAATTTVTGLVSGTYVFNLLTTDNNTGTQSANVTINVSSGAVSATVSVSAGSALSTTLPTNTVTLSGTATTSSGTVSSYTWTQTSGPAQSTIDNRNNGIAYVSGLVAGTYVFTLTATNSSGTTGSSNVTVVVNPAVSSTPTSVYTTIPGTIQAESYSAMSGVGTETTTDIGGGLDVGWIDAGDYMSYNVNATTAGSYTVSFRVSSPLTGNGFQLKAADGTVLATVTVPNTGGWEAWQTVAAVITLPAGNQTLKVVSVGANWNFNWMQFAFNQTAAYTKVIPGTIQAEDYDAQFNTGSQTTTDVGGGLNMDYLTLGSSMTYNVSVAQAGTYTVGFRVATTNAGAKFQLRNSSGTVLASFTLSSTGGYQAWQTWKATVTLPAGNQTLVVLSTATPYWNFNWMSYTATSTTEVTPEAQEGQATPITAAASTDSSDIASSLTLFPNPVRDQFSIDVNNVLMGNVTIQVLNQGGQVLKTYSFVKSVTESRFDLSAAGLSDGIYFVRVQIGSRSHTLRMLKMRN